MASGIALHLPVNWSASVSNRENGGIVWLVIITIESDQFEIEKFWVLPEETHAATLFEKEEVDL